MMKENHNPKAIYLKDYSPPAYFIEHTKLAFYLGEQGTKVCSELSLVLNEDLASSGLPELVLDGVDLELLSVALNGESLTETQYQLGEESLRVQVEEKQINEGGFTLQIQTLIHPENNTALEGLYVSKGMYCTQCEAHGFRRITYYLDRPDVMSVFDVYVEADQQAYPVLLSNGNCVEQGVHDNGRHWVRWQDPFKKPCYLFALVAGDLQCVEDEFVRASGKPVSLQLFVEAHDVDKCDYALASLKKAMQWDEQVFGREYDLDIYMIVAVSHFNMGAMENKGLNIFNTSCVLANQLTTTDMGFERVEGVVAHEYFHNWSGNRVTCRDWFQLSLKEGFTVFRDEEFSSDMGNRTLKRIDDVNILRNFQFKEDSGPMAHPVRPASYIEMNNFYTVTVYNKGAEVVRMLHTILGAEQFRKACDLYFDSFDGQAITCDDFVTCMEKVSGHDFTQFKNWYSQAGTPTVKFESDYDEAGKRLRLHVEQSCPATPGQAEKAAFVIPVSVALFSSSGEKLTFSDAQSDTDDALLIVDQEQQEFVFENVESKPLLSLLRNFSAPVKVDYLYSPEQLAFLMAKDDDGFNAWDAGQCLFLETLEKLVTDHEQGVEFSFASHLEQALKTLLSSQDKDPAVLARMLCLPSKSYLAEQYTGINADAVIAAHNYLEYEIAARFRDYFFELYQQNNITQDYLPEAGQIAKRSLKNICLRYLCLSGEDSAVLSLAEKQFKSADNMTDQSAALRALVNFQGAASKASKNQALEQFFEQWQHEALVVDQWFSIQATAKSESLLDDVKNLMAHPLFDIKNPNRVRALFSAFAQNYEYFHAADGSGYRFLAEQVKTLDTLNPQIAARLASVLVHWKRYQGQRSEFMKSELEALKALKNVSRDVYEIVDKALAD